MPVWFSRALLSPFKVTLIPVGLSGEPELERFLSYLKHCTIIAKESSFED